MAPGSPRAQVVLPAGVLLSGFGLLLLVGAVLRETPLFWCQAGGYPVALRQAVRLLFYPALVVYGSWLVPVTALSWLGLCRGSRAAAACLVVSALNWLLLATVVIVIAWNNVANLLHGLPLHYHAA